MTLSAIHITLNRHLTALPNAPKTIIFDNAPSSDIELGALALEAVLLPTSRRAMDFCLHIEQRGIYSINVFAPLHGGATAAMDWAQQVAQHFAHQTLANVQCLNAHITRVGKVGEHFVFNVSVDYRAMGE